MTHDELKIAVRDKIMHLDLETENWPYYGAVASPRHPDNYVVLNGWRIDAPGKVGEVQHYEADTHGDWLNIPDDVWLLVCHNAPFELDWMLVQQREELMKFLKRGGRVWCTAYAHYLLSNQLDTYPSLNEIAPMYGGTQKVDGVKILWEQGYRTSQIDRELLRRYLVDPVEGDVANTATVFYGQYAQLTARGMLNMAFERMEGMLFCAFAMDSGLKINREVAFKQLKLQVEELEALRSGFNVHRKNFHPEVEFKESSDYHMSAWLFGGPIKYRSRVPALNDDGSPKYEKADFVTCTKTGCAIQLNEDGKGTAVINGETVSLGLEELEFETDLEFARYKSGKNKGAIKVERKDTEVVKTKWAELHWECPALVDLGLLPSDIRKSFISEFAGKRTLSDDTPVYSTGADALQMLSVRTELPEEVRQVLKDLLKFAKLDKDIGTYYLRQELDDEGRVTKQSGMLQYLNDKDFVHHTLNMTSTVTGRLSSNRP